MAQPPPIHKTVVYGGEFLYVEGNYIHNSTDSTRSSDDSSRKLLALKQLIEHIAPGAIHNSEERHDQPKCHPRTRKAILEVILNWVKDPSKNSKLLMWLNGPAGAGKSAIMQTIAEICEEEGILGASFFFFRTGPKRSIKTHLIATLAYQLSKLVPHFEDYMVAAIIGDHLIFTKKMAVQMKALVINPFLSATANLRMTGLRKTYLILIDGLDECSPDSAHKEIIILLSSFDVDCLRFLIASRPEYVIRTTFLAPSIHSRTYMLALDDTYKPDVDIQVLLLSTFDNIKASHPLRRSIPTTWPSAEHIQQLVATSSGQFIYVATVLKFIDSHRHNPMRRLDTILEARLSKDDATSPFAQLDAVYHQILASAEDLSKVLDIINCINYMWRSEWKLPRVIEILLGYTEGETSLILCDMHSLVQVPSQEDAHMAHGRLIQPHHASLRDFLQDPLRCKHLHHKPAYVYAQISLRMILSFRDLIQALDNISLILSTLYFVIEQAELTEELSTALLAFNIYNDKVDSYFEHRGFAHQGVTKLFIKWEKLYNMVFHKAGPRVYEKFVHSLDIWVAHILQHWHLGQRQGFPEMPYHWIILVVAFARAPILSENNFDYPLYVAYDVNWWDPNSKGFFHAIVTITSNPSLHTHKVLTETPGLTERLTLYYIYFIKRYPPWYLNTISVPHGESLATNIVRTPGGISHFRHCIEHYTRSGDAVFIDVSTGIPNTSIGPLYPPSVHMNLFPLNIDHITHPHMHNLDTTPKNMFNGQGVAEIEGPDLELNYGLTITNNSDRDLFVYLSFFEPHTYTVANWYYPASSEDNLKKKAILSIGHGPGIEGENPYNFRLDDTTANKRQKNFIKLFVSTEYFDISLLANDPYTELEREMAEETTTHTHAYGLLVTEIHFIP